MTIVDDARVHRRDPRAILDRLRDAGGAEDFRPPEAVVAELDGLAGELRAVLSAEEAEKRRDALLAEVDQLREAVVEGPEALDRFIERLGAAKRALGVTEIRRVRPFAERVLARLNRGPLLHIRTGFETLDEATRDGLLASRVHVIGGEPDAGKTAILLQMILHAARSGYAAVIHAVDEPGDGIEDRIGQAWGASLEDMEAGTQAAILHLAGQLRNVPELVLIDQVEDKFTVEDSAELALAHARELGLKGAVLGIDSMQTARCRAMFAPGAPRDPRDKIELLCSALRDIARRGVCVVCTSELNRNFYKEKDGARGRAQPSEMGAFKNSGSIEYLMTTGLLVTRLKTGEHAGDYRVSLPKNKRGEPGVAFRLAFDRGRCAFTDCGRFELPPDEASGGAPGPPKEEKPVPEQALDRVRYVLRCKPKGLAGGIEALIEAAKPIKTSVARRAIRQLQAAEEIVRVGDRLFCRELVPAKSTTPAEETAAELRGRVLEYFDAELAAGRPVPSRGAIVQGLRDAGKGAKAAHVYDAIEVLVAEGRIVGDGRGYRLP